MTREERFALVAFADREARTSIIVGGAIGHKAGSGLADRAPDTFQAFDEQFNRSSAVGGRD
ncbi:MAG: hypothetical protein WCF24_04700 [Acidimicrobiales bacterium]